MILFFVGGILYLLGWALVLMASAVLITLAIIIGLIMRVLCLGYHLICRHPAAIATAPGPRNPRLYHSDRR